MEWRRFVTYLWNDPRIMLASWHSLMWNCGDGYSVQGWGSISVPVQTSVVYSGLLTAVTGKRSGDGVGAVASDKVQQRSWTTRHRSAPDLPPWTPGGSPPPHVEWSWHR